MEARAPLAKEKARTPIFMIRIQNNLSRGVDIGMSPYPTVVTVYTVKYTDVR